MIPSVDHTCHQQKPSNCYQYSKLLHDTHLHCTSPIFFFKKAKLIGNECELVRTHSLFNHLNSIGGEKKVITADLACAHFLVFECVTHFTLSRLLCSVKSAAAATMVSTNKLKSVDFYRSDLRFSTHIFTYFASFTILDAHFYFYFCFFFFLCAGKFQEI